MVIQGYRATKEEEEDLGELETRVKPPNAVNLAFIGLPFLWAALCAQIII